MPAPPALTPEQTVASVVSEVGGARPASEPAAMEAATETHVELQEGSSEEGSHEEGSREEAHTEATMADVAAGPRTPRVSRPGVVDITMHPRPLSVSFV